MTLIDHLRSINKRARLPKSAYFFFFAIAAILVFSLPVGARAQDRYIPPKAIPITTTLPQESGSKESLTTVPHSLHDGLQTSHALSLTATLAGSEMPIQSGLVWRIYAEMPGADPTLMSELVEASPRPILPQGDYVVHVSYGYASAMTHVTLRADSVLRLAINAGGLRVTGVVGTEKISDTDLTYSVYLPEQDNPEARLIAGDIQSGATIRLPEGSYHVVSHYGRSNAMARADLSVEANKVTDATIKHRAAHVTLKLVANEGAEAFAGTAFSILTPGGDTIYEEMGAFPSLILAEGDYVLVARHEGQVYSKDFTVEIGKENNIEIIGTQ